MLKEKILELRENGKSYNEIKKILGCSKGTISYHCGKGQKEKSLIRNKKRRENNIIAKTERFKYRKPNRYLKESVRKFNKRNNDIGKKDRIDPNIKITFTWEDVLNKYGENTNCYLSGIPLNLYNTDCQFDHIIPTSIGGDNSIGNLGMCHKEVNYMKGSMTPDKLIKWCEKILIHNGYSVKNNIN
tara:strand:- start:18036 stop:18593 length:558 start_codon:yes stop_codon:yes gene_type:complete